MFGNGSEVFPVMGTKGVRFEPVRGKDSIVKHGENTTIVTRHQYITSIKQFEDKSLEELRFEDRDPRREDIFGRDVSNTVFANSNFGTGQMSNITESDVARSSPNPFEFATNNVSSSGRNIFTTNLTPSNPSFGASQAPETLPTSTFIQKSGKGLSVTSSTELTACGTTFSSTNSLSDIPTLLDEIDVFGKGRSINKGRGLKPSRGSTTDHKQFASETQIFGILFMCPQHPLKVSQFYCTDCLTGSCCQCLTNHKTHNWITKEEYDTNQKHDLIDIQKSYEKETSEIDNLLKTIHKYTETIVIQQEQYTNIITSMMKCRNNLRNNTSITELSNLGNTMQHDQERILQLIKQL